MPGKMTQGFTLVEASIAIALMSLLFVGSLTLYVSSGQLALKTHAAGFATADAANAVQRIVADTHHALWIALPGDADTAFMPPPNTSGTSFTTTVQGQNIDTAVEIMFPSSGTVTVQTSLSSTTTDMTLDRTTPGSALWVYRSDSGGVPNAATGQYLWVRGNERGQAVDRALLQSLSATNLGAVQFIRPSAAGSPAGLLPYQLKIKIVSAYYSLINGAQTSESTDGAQTTALTGKCALLRDHELNLDHEPGAGAATDIPTAPWLSN